MASKTYTLNSGYKIPAIGLGTWLSGPDEVAKAVEVALKNGYRHIDGAACYQNEEEVGRGWKASGVPRSEIFLTSKLWNNAHHPDAVEAACDKTLKELGTDYLDLYLIHWPVPFKTGPEMFPQDPETGLIARDPSIKTEDTWKAMEALVEKGKVRSIGVSNFTKDRLEKLLPHCKIIPAVNQIEAHPYLQQPELYNYLKEKGILIQSYSPLGNNEYGMPRVLDDPKVKEVADELNITPAQALIAWAVKRDTVVLPKSVTPSRIISNFTDIELTDAAFEKLNSLEKNLRYNVPKFWGDDMFGELGQEEVDAAARKYAEEHPVKKQ
ncbi:hypothetical protein KEM55_003293 [Ascosphaera atra]|nr:hypothetical protein KEM55_003293 [Ascosphaera atra]